ncbi:MAG: radical SAM protein, partial [Deltaproteobacteria bacterium HGW-Deltaproteobacteria-17]
MHLLLTSVFGPFGVDDPFGSRYNKMELFHNQVTREQGLFSFRFNHPSFGLHFLAENVSVPTTVLDFPSYAKFVREVRSGRYTHVGISFIVPNFEKAKAMAEFVRQADPGIQIILGGHGTSIPESRTQIPHDHYCVGEGVRFLRRIFGENEDRALVHPLVHSSFNKNVMGVTFLWMGVESKKACYEKNAGVDFQDLVAQLRGRGISVMTSVILFEEHHDHETIWEDIDFGISLKADYMQFMQLGPMNGTTLYDDYVARGKMLPGIPFRERHGQEKIWFSHPAFSREESQTFLTAAFAQDYRESGPSY